MFCHVPVSFLAVSAGPGCPFAGAWRLVFTVDGPGHPSGSRASLLRAYRARAGARVSAPARFARLIARMRLCARRRRPTPPGCHEMSCFVMVRRCRLRLQRTCSVRASAAGASLAAGIAARAGRRSVAVISSPCPVGSGGSLCRARFAGVRARASPPARFARLIARARRWAHLSRRFHRWFSNMAPPGHGGAGETAPDAASPGPISV